MKLTVQLHAGSSGIILQNARIIFWCTCFNFFCPKKLQNIQNLPGKKLVLLVGVRHFVFICNVCYKCVYSTLNENKIY